MKYGIICAMEEEIKELRAQLTHSTEKTRSEERRVGKEC